MRRLAFARNQRDDWCYGQPQEQPIAIPGTARRRVRDLDDHRAGWQPTLRDPFSDGGSPAGRAAATNVETKEKQGAIENCEVVQETNMRMETKFLRLRTEVELGSLFDDWTVCWLGGWSKHRLYYLVMLTRTAR